MKKQNNFAKLGLGLVALLCVAVGKPAFGVDGIYVGGRVGQVLLSGDYATGLNNAIGFGADLGFRQSIVDVVLSFSTSSHSGAYNLSIYAPTMSADIHLGQIYDFDFSVGAGPGFYIFKTDLASQTKFGLNFGGNVDVVLDNIRVGFGPRYHTVFDTNGGGNFWQLMLRAGYTFDN